MMATSAAAHRDRTGVTSGTSHIAAIPSSEVAKLSRDELMEIIHIVAVPFAVRSNLKYQDRQTLERLAHLSRRTCRNRRD